MSTQMKSSGGNRNILSLNSSSQSLNKSKTTGDNNGVTIMDNNGVNDSPNPDKKEVVENPIKASIEKKVKKTSSSDAASTSPTPENKKEISNHQENGFSNGHNKSNEIKTKKDEKVKTTDKSHVNSDTINEKERTFKETKKTEQEKTQNDKMKINDEKEKLIKKTEVLESSQKSSTHKKEKSPKDSIPGQSPKRGEQRLRQSLRTIEKKQIKGKEETATDVIVISDSSESYKFQESEVIDVTENEPESSVFDPDNNELPVGLPEASSTPGKVLKHHLGPLKRDSKEIISSNDTKPETVDDEKVIVKEICSSDNKPEKADVSEKMDNEKVQPSSSFNNTPYSFKSLSRPIGKISGRKSIRDIREYSFENRYPGVYRQIPDDDKWSSSMNVTIGSDICNDTIASSSWFSFGSRGKKRERTPPPHTSVIDNQESDVSPKRARLDVSGFFNFIATPVTKLREKFSRAKIQINTTPNGKTNENNDIDGLHENDVDELNFEENEFRIPVNEENSLETEIDNNISIEEGVSVNAIDFKAEKENKSSLNVNDENKDDSKDEEEVIVKETFFEGNDKKTMCTIM